MDTYKPALDAVEALVSDPPNKSTLYPLDIDGPLPAFGCVPSMRDLVVSSDGRVFRAYDELPQVTHAKTGERAVYVYATLGDRWMAVPLLMALAFLPKAPGHPFVKHKDGNKLFNHRDNLEWSRARESSRMPKKRIYLLDAEDIAAVRALRMLGCSWEECAEEFGITALQVQAAVTAKRPKRAV